MIWLALRAIWAQSIEEWILLRNLNWQTGVRIPRRPLSCISLSLSLPRERSSRGFRGEPICICDSFKTNMVTARWKETGFSSFKSYSVGGRVNRSVVSITCSFHTLSPARETLLYQVKRRDHNTHAWRKHEFSSVGLPSRAGHTFLFLKFKMLGCLFCVFFDGEFKYEIIFLIGQLLPTSICIFKSVIVPIIPHL